MTAAGFPPPYLRGAPVAERSQLTKPRGQWRCPNQVAGVGELSRASRSQDGGLVAGQDASPGSPPMRTRRQQHHYSRDSRLEIDTGRRQRKGAILARCSRQITASGNGWAYISVALFPRGIPATFQPLSPVRSCKGMSPCQRPGAHTLANATWTWLLPKKDKKPARLRALD